jgi:cytochrome c biogenesis protein CcdA
MFDAPYLLALSAGVLAAVNPCGFAMLPAYVSLLITGESASAAPLSLSARLRRALALTGAMTLGFAAFFGAFGLLAAPAADWLATRLPWLTIIIGLILAVLGVWLLAGKNLPSPVAKLATAPELRQRFWPMFSFGISFAIASLGCTIGPFLAVVIASFTTESPAAGAGLFIAYAAGMALIVGAVSVAVAAAQQSMIRWMRRAASLITRTAGALMIIAGAYVAWYGWYEIRVFSGAVTSDPIIDTAADVQTWLATTVNNVGPASLAIFVLAFVAIAAAIAWWRNRRDDH